MKPYEVMFILDPTAVADDAVDGYIERVTNLITQQGGTVTGVDKWGKRRFAYEIKGRTEGYYVVMTFQGSREVVAELNRVLRLTDDVIRHLVVRQNESAKAAATSSSSTAQATPASSGEAAGEGAQSGGPEAGASEAAPSEPVATEAAEATT